MGSRKKNQKRTTFKPSGLVGTREDAEREFRAMVKALCCPACHVEFTDFAIEWGDIWCEGRWDLLRELGQAERDGPFKLKCELCGHKSWLNYFDGTVASAEPDRP